MKVLIMKQLIKDLIGPPAPELEKIQWQPASGGYAFPIEAKKNAKAFAKRWQASVKLGAAAVPALTDNLRHPIWTVRRTAMWALVRYGQSALRAVPALAERLRSDDDFHNRAAAAWCLQRLGKRAGKKYPQTVPALAQALTDAEEAVRLNAAAALGALGRSAAPALPELRQALTHSSQATRIYAALAIGELGSAAGVAVQDLTKTLATISDDAQAREKIRRIIKQFTGALPPNPPEPKPPIKACPWPAPAAYFRKPAE